MLKGYKFNWDPEDAYIVTSSADLGGCIVVNKDNMVKLRLVLDISEVEEHFEIIEKLNEKQIKHILNMWSSPDCVGQQLELAAIK